MVFVMFEVVTHAGPPVSDIIALVCAGIIVGVAVVGVTVWMIDTTGSRPKVAYPSPVGNPVPGVAPPDLTDTSESADGGWWTPQADASGCQADPFVKPIHARRSDTMSLDRYSSKLRFDEAQCAHCGEFEGRKRRDRSKCLACRAALLRSGQPIEFAAFIPPTERLPNAI